MAVHRMLSPINFIILGHLAFAIRPFIFRRIAIFPASILDQVWTGLILVLGLFSEP